MDEVDPCNAVKWNAEHIVDTLDFTAFTELTISGGAITVTQSCHTVDTEGNAASDDLDTVNGGVEGRIIFLRAEHDARTIVIKHNTGNIWLQGKADISLDEVGDGILLVCDGTRWFDIGAGPFSGDFLKADGSVQLTGDMSVADSKKIDGVDISAHDVATTGVHGVGAGTVAKVADIATDTNLSAAAQAAIAASHARSHATASASDHSDWPVGLDVTELGYVDGVTAAIQTQLDAKTLKATLTEQGDLYYASAASTPAALAHGADTTYFLRTGGHGANPSWAIPDHGSLGGLTDYADHPGFLLIAGTRNWNLPTPADHSAEGITLTAVAGEAVALADVCYLKSDGKFWLADADAEATTKGTLALATAAIAQDASGVFLLIGRFRDDTWAWATKGAELYIHTTPGNPTDTVPSGSGDQIRVVGHVIDADNIEFNPSQEYDELV